MLARADGTAPPASAASSPPSAVEPQAAPNVHEAQRHHERAVALYDAGELPGARRELERAYELAPNFRILFNLGSLSSELQDFAAAAGYFERYLAEGGARISEDRRREVTTELADILPRVAHLDVRVNVAGASILIDDHLVGASPLRDPIRLNPGTHRVEARASGWQPHGSLLELTAGGGLTIELQLSRSIPETPPPRAPAPSETRPSRPGGTSTARAGTAVPWLAWGGSALMVGAAAFCGLQALDKDDEHHSKRGQLGVTRSELDDSRSSVRRWSAATDAFTAAALVMSGVSLYLTLTPEDDAPGRTQAAWSIGVSPNNLHVSAQF